MFARSQYLWVVFYIGASLLASGYKPFFTRLFHSKDVSITVWFLSICLFSAAFDLDEKSLFDTGWNQRLGLSLLVELALQALLLSYEGSRSQVNVAID